MTKEVSSIKEELLKKIKDNVNALTSEPENYDIAKEIVCKFYREGKNAGCKGCSQPIPILIDCTKDYLSKIESRPLDYWASEFDKKEVREKKPLKEVTIGLSCDKCYLSGSCPSFAPLSTCSIDWSLDITDPKEMMDWVIKLQSARVNRHRIVEEVDGGVPDATLSTEIDRLNGLIKAKNDLNINKFSLNIEAQGNAAGGGGILSKLFGPPQEQKTIEEVKPQIIDISSLEFKDAEVVPINKSEETETKKSRRKKE